jgi:cellulose biosynthesis protein BcsQ
VLLIDGDTETNSAMGWAARRSQERPPLPFDVVSQRAAHIAAGKGNYGLYIIDTKAAPREQDLCETANGSDLIVVPTFPDGGSITATFNTVMMIKELAPKCLGKVRVLINNVMAQALTQAMDVEAGFKNGPGILCLPGHMTCYRSAYHPATNDGLLVCEVRSDTALKAWAQCKAMSDHIMNLLPMEAVHE